MSSDDRTIVRVRAGWHEWECADVDVCALSDFHWYQPLGAPQPILHAFVSWADPAVRSIRHECRRDSAPQRLRVCVLRHDTCPGVYRRLAERAGGATDMFTVRDRADSPRTRVATAGELRA
jgi:hypothetical protein